MTKREQRLREKLGKSYDIACDELGLNGHTKHEQSIMLIDAGDALMGEICGEADSIKIDDYEEVKDRTNISSGDYQKIVALGYRTSKKNLSEKARMKLEQEVNANIFKASVSKSVSETGDFVFDVDNEGANLEPEINDSDFEEIFNKSVATRTHLNDVLWKHYRLYAEAFIYLHDLEYSYSDYKLLVDYQHYRDGGYPKPTTPGKHVSFIARVNKILRLMDDFKEKYPYFWEGLNDNYGIDVNFTKTRDEIIPLTGPDLDEEND